MTTTAGTFSRASGRAAAITAGLLVVLLPLAACAADQQPSGGPSPTNISIAPPSPTPVLSSSPTPGGGPSKPATDPSTAQTETVRDAVSAVTVAESAVADSVAVEVSEDDDGGRVEWEVILRAGSNARVLRIGADGAVLNNQSESLSTAQRGDLPKVLIRDAIEVAEKQLDGGVVTDAELTTENRQRVWDMSVDAAGGAEWELWIDASSGKVLREERD